MIFPTTSEPVIHISQSLK